MGSVTNHKMEGVEQLLPSDNTPETPVVQVSMPDISPVFAGNLQFMSADFIAKAFKINKVSPENAVLVGRGLKAKGLNDLNLSSGKNNKLVLHDGVEINNLKIRIHGHNNVISLGKNVRWSGHLLIVGNGLKIDIDENTTAQGVYILSREASVYIGKDCMLSREIEIRATDVHKVFDRDTKKRLNGVHADIRIGDHVWVAAKVLISKNVSIPSGCIVGAGSFVNRSFSEENAIIVGTPASIKKRNIYWER